MPEARIRKPNKALTALIANTGKTEAECRKMLGMPPAPSRLTGKTVTTVLAEDVLAKVDALAAKGHTTRPAALAQIVTGWAAGKIAA